MEVVVWGKMFNVMYLYFVIGNFILQNVFFGDQEYGLVFDCLVKVCMDLFIFDFDDFDCKVFLGKCIVEFQLDWWYDLFVYLCIIDLWVFCFNIVFWNVGYVEVINIYFVQEIKYVDF